jgi:hypothetical protein
MNGKAAYSKSVKTVLPAAAAAWASVVVEDTAAECAVDLAAVSEDAVALAAAVEALASADVGVSAAAAVVVAALELVLELALEAAAAVVLMLPLRRQ